jgi:hypothetical protein
MKMPGELGVVAAVLCLGGLAVLGPGSRARGQGAKAGSPSPPKPPASDPRVRAAGAAMARAARAFLDSLSSEQRAQAVFPFDAEERLNWHFVPRSRQGIPFKAMGERQRQLAHNFLRAGLSQAGYTKATTIISLEDILRVLEGGRGPDRDPELYYFSFFGEPLQRETWGWRVEGHHLSLNFTVVRGRLIASTPQFLGANPAEVPEGPRKGLRALPAEEDLARELLKSFDTVRRTEVVIATEAPRDIITGNSRKAEIGEPKGVPAARMDRRQRGLLLALLEEYARSMPTAVARERMERLRQAGVDKIYFAWAGGSERGQPHYYRIQGPTFLCEYDNTQNGANHVHSVWRDFKGDFGVDLLRLHYDTAHSRPGHE